MKTIKIVLATLACLALLAVIGVYQAAAWFSSNKEEIAEEAVKLSGFPKRKCEQLEASYQRAWDAAVDRGSLEANEDQLNRMRDEIDTMCRDI
jgi:Tfp pilus assembly protein PilO